MRVNKYLAECGVGSRRFCDKLIEDNKVKVNGKPCTLGMDVSEADDIKVDGKSVGGIKRLEYYMLNKPKGYISTVSDDKSRKTVMDLLPAIAGRVFPVGRLDYDSEGLLILTNDGDMAYALTHPKYEIPKTYSVKIEGYISDKQLVDFKKGIVIEGEKTPVTATVAVVERTRAYTKLEIVISEGKNREIRKMFEAIGYEVEFLKRVKIGDLKLSGLDRGEVRRLKPVEIAYLNKLIDRKAENI